MSDEYLSRRFTEDSRRAPAKRGQYATLEWSGNDMAQLPRARRTNGCLVAVVGECRLLLFFFFSPGSVQYGKKTGKVVLHGAGDALTIVHFFLSHFWLLAGSFCAQSTSIK